MEQEALDGNSPVATPRLPRGHALPRQPRGPRPGQVALVGVPPSNPKVLTSLHLGVLPY